MSATTTIPAAGRDIRVLVIDDHPALRAGLRDLLDTEPGFDFVAALSPEDGFLAAVAQSRPDVVVLDYALGADDGLSSAFASSSTRGTRIAHRSDGHDVMQPAVPATIGCIAASLGPLTVSDPQPRPSACSPPPWRDGAEVSAASARPGARRARPSRG